LNNAMKRSSQLVNRILMSRVLLSLAILGGALASYAFFTNRAEQQAIARVERNAQETLRVQSDSILRQLEKQRYLPKLLSRHPVVVSFMEANQAFGRDRIHHVLQESAGFSGAIDVGLTKLDGTLLASASDYLETPIVSGNELQFAALQGRLGRASISDATGRRGYAFSSPVRSGNRIIGIIIAVSPLEGIEQSWALSSNPIFAVNHAGQMVAGNLLARNQSEVVGDITLARTRNGGILENGSIFGDLVVYHREIPHLNLDLHTLVPRQPMIQARQNAGMIALLLTVLAGGALFFMQSRVRASEHQQRRDKANALRLERRVRDRTHELTMTNRKLEREIAERLAAEAQLVHAQEELVQAEKLAAIGQMSATLAHEYNQPLAAIRGYADNASRFLERSNHDKVGSNLERIANLVDRLAALSKTLLAFARKPDAESGHASVNRAIRDAIQVTEMKADNSGVRIFWEPGADVEVCGEELRLSQVFVNLISNAIDACASSGGEVRLSRVVENGKAKIFVRDNGQGIAPEAITRIFDPFFTTKEVGEGLGLGLSIAYNTIRDFGGWMTASNAPDGGAEISVELPLSKTIKQLMTGDVEPAMDREPAE
jgi:two-component system C4-dicarboxylate transport sensor histidine kinase DctB